MPANYDVIDFFIYDQFGTIRKVDSGRMACKSYIFINSNLFITKTKSRTKISLTQFSYYCFELSKDTTIFAKNIDFFGKNADISKI